MKTKLLLIAILMTILASCTSATCEKWDDEHDEGCIAVITKFKYEGHSYLLFRTYHGEVAGIAHDANCPCYEISDSDYCR